MNINNVESNGTRFASQRIEHIKRSRAMYEELDLQVRGVLKQIGNTMNWESVIGDDYREEMEVASLLSPIEPFWRMRCAKNGKAFTVEVRLNGVTDIQKNYIIILNHPNTPVIEPISDESQKEGYYIPSMYVENAEFSLENLVMHLEHASADFAQALR